MHHKKIQSGQQWQSDNSFNEGVLPGRCINVISHAFAPPADSSMKSLGSQPIDNHFIAFFFFTDSQVLTSATQVELHFFFQADTTACFRGQFNGRNASMFTSQRSTRRSLWAGLSRRHQHVVSSRRVEHNDISDRGGMIGQ